ELAAIRKHLLPLDLTDNETTLTLELIRLLIHKSQHDRQKHATVPKEETRRGQTKPRKVARRKGHLPDSPGKKLGAKDGV
ncbi:MAG: hypothetical protein FWD31_15575, partial [Planctomycetaceae bacterium]|nr:hypothetical protein [Planctomycetaceae bacterium]